MATKTANLYARIEPETKSMAEAILDTLGIPVSTAINMFYKQIILNKGLPFEAKIPKERKISLSDMTKEEFNSEMERALKCMENEEGIPLEEAFASIKRA